MDYILGETLHLSPYIRVVKAKTQRSEQPLALKLPNEAAPAERTLSRLRHEYALLREVQGPGVVRVVELIPWGAGHALVMERWGEGSLDRLLQSGPLPLRSALGLGAVLARALGQVHRKGIIHREVLLIDSDCLRSSGKPPQRRRQDDDHSQHRQETHIPLS